MQQSCSSGKDLNCLNSHSEAKQLHNDYLFYSERRLFLVRRKKNNSIDAKLPKGGENKSFIGSLKDHYSSPNVHHVLLF